MNSFPDIILLNFWAKLSAILLYNFIGFEQENIYFLKKINMPASYNIYYNHKKKM